MAIHTQQSLSGFIASKPQLSFTDRGDARFYAKVGQEHFQRNDDGSFTKLETTFHDLVQYRRTAERSYAAFAKGDKFVAEGYVHPYEYANAEGQAIQGEEFVAKKIGHDTARTTYTVDRNRPDHAPSPEQGIDNTGSERDLAPASEPPPASPPSNPAVSL